MSQAESSSVIIRPREPSDVPTLINILQDVYDLTKYPVDGPSSFPARFTSPNALASFVVTYNSTLAGHAEIQDASKHSPGITATLQPIESYAAFVSLFVDPKIQGKGVGKRLVQEAVAWGKKEGKRLVLIVLDKDEAAIRMYERMGWEKGNVYPYKTKDGREYQATMYVSPKL